MRRFSANYKSMSKRKPKIEEDLFGPYAIFIKPSKNQTDYMGVKMRKWLEIRDKLYANKTAAE